MPRTKEEIISFLTERIAEYQGVGPEEINITEEFRSQRLDSMDAALLVYELEKFTGKDINPIEFWNHPTIEEFAEFITTPKN